jgi:hypothetical protein
VGRLWEGLAFNTLGSSGGFGVGALEIAGVRAGWQLKELLLMGVVKCPQRSLRKWKPY